MQIFAFDNTSKLISALQAERKKNYICPECHQIVRLRGGFQKRLHFYHPKNSQCSLSKKTQLHLNIQLFIASLLPPHECHLEKPFSSIRRIADCVWESQKLVFEIQCSFLHKDEILNRINDYHSCGYKVVWILHEKTFCPKNLNSAQFVLKNFSHYYTNLNQKGQGIIFDYFENQKQEINLLKPLFPPLSKPLKCHIAQRKKWPLYFEGTIFSSKRKLKQELFLTRFLRGLSFLLLTHQR